MHLNLKFVNHTNETEPEIWKRFKNGDREAFSQIFFKYKDLLYNYGITVFSDDEIVNDCIQELFLEIWVKRQNLADVNSVKYYLIKSLRRMIIRKRIFYKKKIDKDEFLHTYEFGDKTNSYEFEIISAQSQLEVREALEREISNLPKRQKEALYLRYYQRMSYDEITSIMNLTYKSVRNLICLAIKALRKNMRPKVNM